MSSKAKPSYRDVLLTGLRPEDLLKSALKREFKASINRMVELAVARQARQAAREEEPYFGDDDEEEVQVSSDVRAVATRTRRRNKNPYGGVWSVYAVLRGSYL